MKQSMFLFIRLHRYTEQQLNILRVKGIYIRLMLTSTSFVNLLSDQETDPIFIVLIFKGHVSFLPWKYLDKLAHP